MSKFTVLAGGVMIVLAAGACSSRTGLVNEVPSRNILTHEQVKETNSVNVYEAISALRLNWLSPRGVDSFYTPGEVQVYFNDIHLGGVETLRNIAISDVGHIRYYNGVDAAARWGLDHGHGVIYVAGLP